MVHGNKTNPFDNVAQDFGDFWENLGLTFGTILTPF
jgi:hypothetical protein